MKTCDQRHVFQVTGEETGSRKLGQPRLIADSMLAGSVGEREKLINGTAEDHQERGS
jgi:hypothetical protein